MVAGPVRPWRLALFYGAFFAVIGVQQPFWPLWLAAKGLDAAGIGIVLALSIGIKILSTPIAAHVADRTGERRRPILWLTALAFISFAQFGWTDTVTSIVIVSLVFYAVWPPAMPLAETLTVKAATDSGFTYGRIRLWGSLAFIVTATLAGWVLEVVPPAPVVFWIAFAAIGVTLATAWLLPDVRGEPGTGRLPLLDSLADRPLLWSLVACGLIQGSHAVYYAFATLHWQAAGLSEFAIGALWAEGVIAEIILFIWGRAALARFGAIGLMRLAAAACVVRWIGTGLWTELPVLIVMQALHAFTFGAAHLAAMHFIANHVGPNRSATAQSLYSGVVWGLFLGLLLLAAGFLYGRLGSSAFFAMAAVGLAGGIVSLRLDRAGAGTRTPARHDEHL